MWKQAFAATSKSRSVPNGTDTAPLGLIDPPDPAEAVMIGSRIVKFASLASEARLQAASCAVTRTRACVVGVFGTVHG